MYQGTSQSAICNCGERSNSTFRRETETQPIKTYASEKNNEAKGDHLSATAGDQADKLPTQT